MTDAKTACDNWPIDSTILKLKETVGDLRETLEEMTPEFESIEEELKRRVEQMMMDYRDAHSVFLDNYNRIKKGLETEEQKLRDALIEWSKETKEKTFDGHMQVRVLTKLVYKPEDATAWAKENASFILVADKKQFEQIALKNKFNFVNYEDNYVAALAKDFRSKQ